LRDDGAGRRAYRAVFEFRGKTFGVAFGMGVVSGIVIVPASAAVYRGDWKITDGCPTGSVVAAIAIFP